MGASAAENARRICATGAGLDSLFFHLTDAQFSTVAMVQPSYQSLLHERARYRPYGAAEHRFPSDLNDNGVNGEAADEDAFDDALGADLGDAEYDPDADLFRDGTIDTIDAALFAYWSNLPSVAPGRISDALNSASALAPDNPIGYDGYVFNPESNLYTVRFRWYDAVLGRWLERDPLDYHDGMSMYLYVAGRVLQMSDPRGLCTCNPPDPTGDYATDVLNSIDDCNLTVSGGLNIREDNEVEPTPFYDPSNLHDREILEQMVNDMEETLTEMAAAAAQAALTGAECAGYCMGPMGAAEASTLAYELVKRGWRVAKVGGKKVIQWKARRTAKQLAECFDKEIDDAIKKMCQEAGDRPANDVLTKDLLARRLRLQEEGIIIIRRPGEAPLESAGRLVGQYGGKPDEWVKKTTKRICLEDGRTTEIHWYENVTTGLRVEFKSKLPDPRSACPK